MLELYPYLKRVYEDQIVDCMMCREIAIRVSIIILRFMETFLFNNLVLYHDLSLPSKLTRVIIISFKNIRGSVVLDVMARFITIVLLATFVEGNNEMDLLHSFSHKNIVVDMQLTAACTGTFILVHHPWLLNSNRAQKTCPNQQCGAVWMHQIPQLSTSSPSQMNGKL